MTPSGEKKKLVPVEPARVHHRQSEFGKFVSGEGATPPQLPGNSPPDFSSSTETDINPLPKVQMGSGAVAQRRCMVQGWTLALGVIYLATFHLWMRLDRPAIITSTLVITALATTLLMVANKRSYFINAWDKLFHASVVADIFAEGLLIPAHEDYGFYLCALAFGVVILGYRLRQFGRLSRRLSRHLSANGV
ncbi:MAG: hypothetical protein EXS31_13385 [Pedosphaera sp.]|nr:hypothetical protein [Pedosphaera sp.]